MSDEPTFPFLVLDTGDRRDRPHLIVSLAVVSLGTRQ
jgi:hypothetical protein